MVSSKTNWIEILRMFTAPLSAIGVMLIGTLLWVYQNDRTEAKQNDQKILSRIDSGFSEMAGEFKEIRRNESEYREKIATKIATIQGVCCSESRMRSFE